MWAVWIILALLALGSSGIADPAVGVFHADRIDGDRVITREDVSVSFYGVRMVGKETDPALHQRAVRFLTEAFDTLPFRLDDAVFCESGIGVNRYGDRQGMILLADGRWLQEELVLRGFGLWNGAASYPLPLRERLIRAEKAAMIEKSGIWRRFSIIDANRPPKAYWKGEFVIAEGTIRDVYRSPSVTYLNFGDDWRTDFTAAIPARARKKFEAGGWKLADLKNRSVTIRGRVRFYNGPYMELDFPEQLEREEVVGEE